MVIKTGAVDRLKTNHLRQKMLERSPDEDPELAQLHCVTLNNSLMEQQEQQFQAKIEVGLNCPTQAQKGSSGSSDPAHNISSQTKDNFQTIFEQPNIGIAFIATSGQFLRANPSLCSLLQYTEAVMCSHTFQDITHTEDLETVWQSIDRVLSGSQSSQTIEQRYLRQDGHWQWVSITFSLVENSQNIPLYLIATIQDIQPRKQAEAKLANKIAIDTAIAQISRKLLGIQEVNYEEILGIIGRAIECDLAYLTCFTVEEPGSNTHHWSKDKDLQKTQLSLRQTIALNQLPSWQEKLSRDEDIVINDIEQSSIITKVEKNILQSLNICSVLIIPILTSSGRVWGTLGLCTQAKNERNWSTEDARQLRILGAIIQSNYRYIVARTKLKASEALSTNFVNHSTEEKQRLDRQTRYSHLLRSITFKTRQSLDIQDILQTTVTELQKTFNADRVLMLQFLPDGAGKVIKESVRSGFPSILDKVVMEEYFRDILPQQYLEGYAYICEDTNNAQLSSCHRAFLRKYQIKANLVIPISRYFPITNSLSCQEKSSQIGNSLWGLLCVQQCSQSRQWSQDEIELLQHLVGQLTIALSQAELLESEINRRKELARSNAELEQFAYIASHDLQAPLQTVTNYVQLLQRRYQDRLDASGEKFIYYITDGVNRMRTQINDLLEYSRVGKQRSTFRTTDCNLVVEQAIANLRSEIDKHQAVVIYCADLPTLIADSSQLIVLFQNLISNAIKYHSQAIPSIKISAERQKDYWQFSVRDNGIGIAPHYRQRIFQIFQRLHTQEEYPGTGMGLAICQKIVEHHGGQIEVDSELDKGSTFYFSLPVS